MHIRGFRLFHIPEIRNKTGQQSAEKAKSEASQCNIQRSREFLRFQTRRCNTDNVYTTAFVWHQMLISEAEHRLTAQFKGEGAQTHFVKQTMHALAWLADQRIYKCT